MTSELEITEPTGAVVQIGTLEVHLHRRPPPAELPAPPRELVGRAGELAAVVRLVLGGTTTVQIIGGPGIGKTALAVQAAHTLRERYPDGQVSLLCHGYDGARRPTASDLLAHVLRSLDVPDQQIPTDPGQREALYRSVLAERRVLVLADDVADREQVRPLVPPAGSALLMTSRTALVGPPAIPVAELGTAAATTILRSARSGPGLDRLVELCAGLPLALQIVAARLTLEPALPATALAQVLARDLSGLAAGDHAVQACFRASYDRLPAAARLTFRRCAVLPLVHVTESSAAALTGLDRPGAAAALDTLAAAHLLTASDDGPAPRYRLHDLLRRYAAERLNNDPDAAAARESLVAHYVGSAPRSVAAAREWFGTEWANVEIVGDHLAARRDRRIHVLADAATQDHDLPVPWEGWLRLQQGALAEALGRDADDPGRAAALQVRLGITMRERRRLDDAMDLLTGAAQRFHRIGDRVEFAGTLGNQAEVWRDRQDWDRAAALYDRAIGILAADPSDAARSSLGWARHGMGDVRTGQGRCAEALRHRRAALAAFRAAGNRFGEVWAWHGIGDTLRVRGRPAAAVAAFRRALDIQAELGNVANAGWTQHSLATLLLAIGHHTAAAELFARAGAAADLRGDRFAHAGALFGLRAAALSRGDHAAAAELAREGDAVARTLAPELRDRLRESRADGNIADPTPL